MLLRSRAEVESVKAPLLAKKRTLVLTGLLGLLASFPSGCGRGEEASPARTAEADSILRAITGPEAGNVALPAIQSGSPRLSPQERATLPLDLNTLGFNDGSPEAPLKVLELSDFGCGYCRRFHAETYPRIRQIYIEAGLVEWKYIPVSIGFPNGLQAAIAGECAGEQEAFSLLRTRLFAEQSQWRGAEDPYPFFSDLAGKEGLDVERFDACIQGGWREARVRDNQRLNGELGVRGTPTFVVDGQLLPGAQPLEAFRDILDAALRRKGVEPPRR